MKTKLIRTALALIALAAITGCEHMKAHPVGWGIAGGLVVGAIAISASDGDTVVVNQGGNCGFGIRSDGSSVPLPC